MPLKEHVECGTLDPKGCRLLQKVYESARARGYSESRSAMQARGALRNAGWYQDGAGVWHKPGSRRPTQRQVRVERDQKRTLNAALRRDT